MSAPTLPYLPPGREIRYVPADHPGMACARQAAQEQSLDPEHPTGAAIFRGDTLLGVGANGSDYHAQYGCERKRLGIPTGQGYEKCPGCNPANHAEQTAIRAVQAAGENCEGADLYLWGHWWCCESCWGVMTSAGIRNVYLMEGAKDAFFKGGHR